MNDTLSRRARADRVNSTTSAMLVVLAHETRRRLSTVEVGSGVPPRLELIMAIRPRASAYEYRILAKARTRFKEAVRPSRADGRWKQIDRLGGVVESLRRRDAGLRQPPWQRRFVRAVHVLKKVLSYICFYMFMVWARAAGSCWCLGPAVA